MLRDHNLFNDSISRAYYAAFHWARALLLLRDTDPRTHRGTIQLFHLHYLKSGLLDDEAGAALSHLESFRELSDYTTEVEFSADDADSEIKRAKAFISACRPILATTHSQL